LCFLLAFTFLFYFLIFLTIRFISSTGYSDIGPDMHRGGSYSHTVFLRSMSRLLVTANVVLSLPILDTLMMEAIRFSETSVLTRAKHPRGLH
jgi:hypothetical protein